MELTFRFGITRGLLITLWQELSWIVQAADEKFESLIIQAADDIFESLSSHMTDIS